MSALCFTLRNSLEFEVNVSVLIPENLKGKTRKQIAAIKLNLGRTTVTVASLFSISGTDSQNIIFANSENKLIHIGENMTEGSIEISGNAGDYLGQAMSGGYIGVSGNGGSFTGAGMTGGKIEIHEDCGDFLGASRVGSTTGMNEGTIIVHGNAGNRTGDRMRRGMIVIFGNNGDYCASNMLAGTIIILGKTGAYPGFSMKRGTLVLGKKPKHLMATFRDCGLLKIEFLRLLFKQLALSCQQFKVFSDFGPEALRFAGDSATDGMGEILILTKCQNLQMKKIKQNKMRLNHRLHDTKSIQEVCDLIVDLPRRRDLLIEYLHLIQDHYHCISDKHIQALAHELKIPSAEVYEVATFYHHFDVVLENDVKPAPLTVRVCESLTCEMFGAKQLLSNLNEMNLDGVRIQAVPCVGRCQNAPVAIVGTNPLANADATAVKSLRDKNDTRIKVEKYIGLVEYRNDGGYKTYQDCLKGKWNADDVISILEDSNLRGLGGAGFPVGRKWRILKSETAPKLIAINIDEGEPGTFKDRHYLETDPHRFIEGALIAHWAIEAEDIYIYLRDEYPGCRLILQKEISELEKISEFNLPKIHLRRGAGAYICGEESAMIESIEGKRGMPRLRPPYVAEVGLFGRPTLEHNMESLHWIRDIIEKGSEWFTGHGRHGRKGLRSFSVSGRVNKPGVHLAPAGITIRELIDEYCEGMLNGHKFYGYFPGGASGGMLPARLGDVPLDFDTLQEHGSFIGSAAVIVMSEHDRAKDMALNAMRFFEHESCGQCTPCRVGTVKASILMRKKSWNLPLLEELASVMEDASICGLGQAAPNPLRTAVKYFPEEFE